MPCVVDEFAGFSSWLQVFPVVVLLTVAPNPKLKSALVRITVAHCPVEVIAADNANPKHKPTLANRFFMIHLTVLKNVKTLSEKILINEPS